VCSNEDDVSQGAPALQSIGRYRLLGELGRGAMGVVYRAEDPNIGRTVALKTQRLDVQGEEQQELLRRLRQEARSAGVLNHPNIVTIYDAGEQDTLFYIAMEYIEGRTLQSMFTPGVPLPIDQVVEIARQVCAGLDYAHARQIVHRDIKPANIMITPEGGAKIMDFGIAKTGSGMTSAGQVLGTPSYMSPEQVKGKVLDGRSDLFSVGVILYEAVTGQKPFTGDNITTIVYKIVNEEPLPPREIDLTVHPGLNQVITRALCKNLDGRYQRGWDLARDLMNYKSLAASAPSADESDQTIALSTAQLREHAAALQQQAVTAAVTSATPAASAPALALEKTSDNPVAAPKPALPAGTEKPAAPAGAMARSTIILLAIVGVLLLVVGVESRAMWRAHLARMQASVIPLPATTTAAPPTAPSAATAAPPANETASTSPVPEKPSAAAPSKVDEPPVSTTTTDAAAAKKSDKKPARSSAKKTEGAETQVVAPALISVNGVLRAMSTPEGAEIVVDGKAQGATPITVPEMSPGVHTVTFSKAGYRSETRNVEVERGKRAQINAVLISSMATVSVNSTPAGASVLIDGNETGKLTPAQVQVAEGGHKVTLKLQGWHTAETSFSLKPGETYNFTPVLTRDTAKLGGFFRKVFGPGDPANKGTLIIRTSPPGATVLVNGNQLPKTTPIPRAPMEPGKYRVTIKLKGYKTIERDVTLEKGKVVDLSGPLEKQ
jgi:eukaryotic-like serine/threonine-protein kinase